MSSTDTRKHKSKAFDGIEKGIGNWLFGYGNNHWLPKLVLLIWAGLMITVVLYVLWNFGVYPYDPREVDLGRR